MATDTGGFQSKFRNRDRQGAGGATGRARRVFESNEERTAVTVSSTGTAGRYRSTGDRGDKSESVTSRMNKLTMNDDKNDSDTEEKAEKNNDDEAEEAKKTHKKDRGGASANSARKRQARKNLREKRRSTGVVIMPGQPVVATDEEEKAVQENTAKNMDAASPSRTSPSSQSNEDHARDVERYEIVIEDWKDELAQAKKEIEALQRDNQRLKDENSALLRVVGSLSGPRK